MKEFSILVSVPEWVDEDYLETWMETAIRHHPSPESMTVEVIEIEEQ